MPVQAPSAPPKPIRTDSSNPFANNTMRVRVPAILRQTLNVNPDYHESIKARLTALCTGIEHNAPIPALDLPAPDHDEWALALRLHSKESWHNTEWFFAETYAYRLVIQAVRWLETLRDPFAPIKAEEYASDALRSLLDTTLAVAHDSLDARLYTALGMALWGNRIDLSYAASREHGTTTQDDDLIADDREAAVRCLMDLRGSDPKTAGYFGKALHIIVDNTGSELAMDLVLADAALDGLADHVVLHLKMHPTFVSDATVADVLAFIAMLEAGRWGETARALGERLRTALENERLRLAPDFYWNSSRFLWEMPQRISAVLRGKSPVILKGDANYRRAVGDAVWEPSTPFAEVMHYFPAPILALRSLKSDPIVGLAPALAEELDLLDPTWRFNGKRGVIQFYGGR